MLQTDIRSSSSSWLAYVILLATSSEVVVGVTYPSAAHQGYGYTQVEHGVDLSGSTDVELLKAGTARSKLECTVRCYSDETCHYAQYQKVSKECKLFKISLSPSAVDPVPSADKDNVVIGAVYQRLDDCSSLMPSDRYNCPLYSKRCQSPWHGTGIYRVDVSDNTFDVYCDLELDGGGWTVFQRRVDATVDFYRPWADYVAGFGDLNGNLWLGLDKLHLLSQDGAELHVYLETFTGESAYAHYSQFSVASDLDNYRLTVGGYSGTAGDSFGSHNGQLFSTYDRDQDGSANNCAADYKGGWWYYSCYDCILNGLYMGESFSNEGIIWNTYMGWGNSYKTVVMKLRGTGL